MAKLVSIPAEAIQLPSTKRPGLDSCATITSYKSGEHICDCDATGDYWRCVVTGVARCFQLRPDGRRQIVDLLLPGDFFGFDFDRDCFAEAVAPHTITAAYSRRRVEEIANRDPSLAIEIWAAAFNALARSHAQLLVLGRVTAQEKVGAFLLDMSERLGDAGDHFVLPISRCDVADYLAVSVETVSRSMTELQHQGAIALAGPRSVQILNRRALAEGLAA